MLSVIELKHRQFRETSFTSAIFDLVLNSSMRFEGWYSFIPHRLVQNQIRTGVFGPVFLHSGCGCGNADLSIYSKDLLFWKCVAATPVQMFELTSDICDGRNTKAIKAKLSNSTKWLPLPVLSSSFQGSVNTQTGAGSQRGSGDSIVIVKWGRYMQTKHSARAYGRDRGMKSTGVCVHTQRLAQTVCLVSCRRSEVRDPSWRGELAQSSRD
ncbi:unnamed protein product [Leuciscus chuanchicus]